MPDPSPLLLSFVLSLVLTLLLETGVALLFRMRRRDLLLLLLVNLLTNPLAVYLNLLFGILLPGAFPLLWQLPLEVAVVVAEGTLYQKCATSLPRPWLFAALANLISYGAGLAINLIL